MRSAISWPWGSALPWRSSSADRPRGAWPRASRSIPEADSVQDVHRHGDARYDHGRARRRSAPGDADDQPGHATTIETSSATSANRRVYIKFDLTGCSPSIPSGANVRAATLRLYMSALPAACRTLDVFRVTSSWTEAGITWNTQPFGTTLNNPATASRTDSFEWLGHGLPEPGRRLRHRRRRHDRCRGLRRGLGDEQRLDDPRRCENSATARTATFSAKNLGTLAQAPQLIVTYTVAP